MSHWSIENSPYSLIAMNSGVLLLGSSFWQNPFEQLDVHSPLKYGQPIMFLDGIPLILYEIPSCVNSAISCTHNYQIKIQVWFLFCWKLTASLVDKWPTGCIPILDGQFPHVYSLWTNHISLMMSYEPIKSSAISVRSSRLLWDSRRHRHSLQQGRCLTLASPGGWWFENFLGYFLTKET